YSCIRVYRLRFAFKDTASTEIYTLSLHDALPISVWPCLSHGQYHPALWQQSWHHHHIRLLRLQGTPPSPLVYAGVLLHRNLAVLDRKSTRLNSSHVKISYAVFCLKKKKKNI